VAVVPLSGETRSYFYTLCITWGVFFKLKGPGIYIN